MKSYFRFILIVLIAILVAYQSKAQSTNCTINNIVVTSIPGNQPTYQITFSLTTSSAINGALTIIGNHNGISFDNMPGTNVNVSAGTHTITTIVKSSAPLPTNTAINVMFAFRRACVVTKQVTFSQAQAQSQLKINGIQCMPNGKMKLNFIIDNVPNYLLNGTASASISNSTLSSVSSNGTITGANTANFSITNLSNGSLLVEMIIVPTNVNVTYFLNFDMKNSQGSKVYNVMTELRPFSNYCTSSNSCADFTVTTEPSAYFSNVAVLYGNFKVSPASQANIVSVKISVISVERRTECTGQLTGNWNSITPTPQLLTYTSSTGVNNLQQSTIVNNPLPNTLQFLSTGPVNASLGADHNLSFKGMPNKLNPDCKERLRFTLRYIVRNDKGCEVEFYRVAEVTR